MEKNVFIAEMLYSVFVHYKGLGKRYNKSTLKKEMQVSLAAVRLLYKNELSSEDTVHIQKMFDISKK